MARSIATIQSIIINTLVTTAAAAGVVLDPATWSQYDYRQLMTYVAASASATLEQLYDAFTVDVEAIVAAAAPQTAPWWQDKMKNLFEYDATAVPIIQLDTDTGAYYYPDPNPDFRIIKYCSVKKAARGVTNIKVAKDSGGLPIALSSTELDAAQGFVNELQVPGIEYTVQSADSDKLYCQAQIYYNGLYAGVLAVPDGTVVAAIKAYLASIPFDGRVLLSDLELAIKSVAGVVDVVFNNVRGRQDTVVYPSGTNLVVANTVVGRYYDTISGYIEAETSSGGTLNDTLTYISV